MAGVGQVGAGSRPPVSETPETPQDGIADALHDLSDQTGALVRREISAGQREMWDKARQSGPALALLAGGGVLALFAAASWYRLSLRLLERRLSPAGAALAAAAGYGCAAAAAAVAGYNRMRQAPVPFPTQTARETAEAVREADSTSPARSGNGRPTTRSRAAGRRSPAAGRPE